MFNSGFIKYLFYPMKRAHQWLSLFFLMRVIFCVILSLLSIVRKHPPAELANDYGSSS